MTTQTLRNFQAAFAAVKQITDPAERRMELLNLRTALMGECQTNGFRPAAVDLLDEVNAAMETASHQGALAAGQTLYAYCTTQHANHEAHISQLCKRNPYM